MNKYFIYIFLIECFLRYKMQRKVHVRVVEERREPSARTNRLVGERLVRVETRTARERRTSSHAAARDLTSESNEQQEHSRSCEQTHAHVRVSHVRVRSSPVFDRESKGIRDSDSYDW